MNEENKFGPKKKWTRIFRKKWFFPSVYLMLAALLLSAVVWYQNTGDEQQEAVLDPNEQTEDYAPTPNEDGAVPVVEPQEMIQMPVASPDEAQIVTKFFDYNADETEKANALIHYNNRYYQSTGVDIAAASAESFDVVASLSGIVTEVKKDPLMGNVVVLTHENEVTTYYASLDEVSVEADDEVEQGEVLGTAGKNIFGKEKGNHVHFELRQAEAKINPETYFNQPVASLNQPTTDADTPATEAEDTEEVGEAEGDEAEVVDETEETDEVDEVDPTESPDEDAELEEDETDDAEESDSDE